MTDRDDAARQAAQAVWEQAAKRFKALIKNGTLEERIAAAERLQEALEQFVVAMRAADST